MNELNEYKEIIVAYDISDIEIIGNKYHFKNNEYQNIYSSFKSMKLFKTYPIMNKNISKELFENGFLGDFPIIGNYEFIIKIN